jgi:hypothetical protein
MIAFDLNKKGSLTKGLHKRGANATMFVLLRDASDVAASRGGSSQRW